MNENETTPWVKITRNELYEKFPLLSNLSFREMLKLVELCFLAGGDGDLIYAIKCYMHSYPELAKNMNVVFPRDD